MVEAAANHRGASFIEVYQNCNIFNDGAFAALKDEGASNQIHLEHGYPIRFGADHERGIVAKKDGSLRIVDVSEVGASRLLVHDAERDDPGLAFALSRLAMSPTGPTPIGIFRQVDRPVYGDLVQAQLDDVAARRGPGDLSKLLAGSDTWEVAAGGIPVG
jgi:2-oxoglutarate ferredoxin oxidoreductase subunit beta